MTPTPGRPQPGTWPGQVDVQGRLRRLVGEGGLLLRDRRAYNRPTVGRSPSRDVRRSDPESPRATNTAGFRLSGRWGDRAACCPLRSPCSIAQQGRSRTASVAVPLMRVEHQSTLALVGPFACEVENRSSTSPALTAGSPEVILLFPETGVPCSEIGTIVTCYWHVTSRRSAPASCGSPRGGAPRSPSGVAPFAREIRVQGGKPSPRP